MAAPQTLGDEYHGATGYCLRADSPDAPATHGEAVKRGEVWVKAEGGEMGNHHRNGSWVLIPRSEVPRGRRIHKLIWVYKVKRDTKRLVKVRPRSGRRRPCRQRADS